MRPRNEPAGASPERIGGSNPTLRRVGSRVLDSTAAHVGQHFALLQPANGNASGRTAFHIKYSTWVALSSVLYMGPALVFWYQDCIVSAAVFMLVSVCSVMADSVTPHSHLANFADRAVATVAGLFYPVRLIFLPGPACASFRVFSLFLLLVCLCFLAWSRQAISQKQYVLRHSLWHAASALGLIYMSHKESTGLIDDWFTL